MTATTAPAAVKARDRLAESKLNTLFFATAAFMIVVMMRPQDIVPVLGLIRPGVLTTGFLFYAVLRYGYDNIPHKNDPLVRCFLWFLGSLVFGLIVVVNHNSWFWTVFAVVSYICAYVIALPILLTSDKYRNRIFAIFLLSFGVGAIFSLTHGGRGPGDWQGDENDMAGALGLGFCIALSYWLAPGRRPFKWLAWAVAGVCALGIVVAGSRGGMLGFIAGGLGIAYFSGKLFRSLLIATVLAVVAIPFLPEETKSDFMSINNKDDTTRQERIYSWQKGWEMFLRSPLLGVGPNNYPWRIGEMQNLNPEFGQPDYWRPLAGRVAHSSYVTVLAETGLTGTIPYALIIVIMLARCRRAIYHDKNITDWQRFAAFAAGSGWLAYGTSAIFISQTYAPPIFMMAGLAISLGYVAPSKPTRKGARPSAARSVRSEHGADEGGDMPKVAGRTKLR
ncbi:MAG TPA: O-antigen ligase family protein [Steroidobacter sp.]|uniref:O-antigen ligase family protein n=1 Tax=Steroidobacter sp. TaxID=1978227 RepID=UPI002ED85455